MRKIKFSNILTKGNETQNQPTSKSKRKIFKAFGFGSLAVMMAVAGTFAFAPLGAGTSLATANESEKTTYTTEQGLITPKADDPTLYTTESGLEIKFGLATPNIETSLATGNLQGFPYFTTTIGSTTYTWVIIGQAQDKPLGVSTPTSYVYSTWTSLSDYYVNKKYFTSNIRETTTPAGSSINSATSSKSYVIDRSKFGDITTNAEISSGCVLVLANGCVASGAFNNTKLGYSSGGNYYYYGNFQSGETMRAAMDGYYTNGTFGLSSIKDKIQKSTVKSRVYTDSMMVSGTAGGWPTEGHLITETCYIFPLCTIENGSTFVWMNYLTASQMKLSTIQLVRGYEYGGGGSSYQSGAHRYHACYSLNTSGVKTGIDCYTSYGYRPAFVLKIT